MIWITNHPKPLKGLWPRRVGCTAFHAVDTCERLDPLAGGQASMLAIIHNDAHGYDKTFPCNMGVTTSKV